LIHRGPLVEDDYYIKSSILHHWLFGYELPDTVLLLRKDGCLWFMGTKKKCDFLKPAADNFPEKTSIKEINLLVRSKENSNSENLNVLWKNALASRIDDEKRNIGVIFKEREANIEGGGILAPWEMKLNADIESATPSIALVDVASGISFAMAIKDETELDLLKKSSVLSNKVMKHGFVKRMEEVIDSEESVKHEDLATYIDEILEDPSKISLKVPKDDVQSCYFPIVQSGGTYDLKVSAQSTSAKLSHDVIMVSLGARYKTYCSNIARTFFVDPPRKVSEIYDILLEMQDACLAVMKHGNQLKLVYKTAVDFLQEKNGYEYLISHLPKNLGYGIGLDFRETTMLLTSKNSFSFKQGMVFCLSLGFQNLSLSESDLANTPSKSPVSAFRNILYQIC
jgi:nucleosome binding factor SPN SPT16 subunit